MWRVAFAFLLSLVWGVCADVRNVQLLVEDDEIFLQNGFVQLVFDTKLHGVRSLSADFHGNGNYGNNIFTRPFVLQSVTNTEQHCSVKETPPTLHVRVQTASYVEIRLVGIEDCRDHGVAKEDWTIAMSEYSRKVDISISGHVTPSEDILYLSHTFNTAASSMYALFDRGMVQMMNNTDSCMSSNDTLPRLYMLGNNVALDIIASSRTETSTVLHSASSAAASAFQDVLYGSMPHVSYEYYNAWSRQCWQAASPVTTQSSSYNLEYSLYPNNYNFPVFPVWNATQNTIPFTDLQSYLTGIYASPAGCLQSYYTHYSGIIAPTVSAPYVGYSPDTNFFDPDNYITLSALMYSGDAYLLQQVRGVIERTAQTMCGIGTEQNETYCNGVDSRRTYQGMHYLHAAKQSISSRYGQLMHHFVNLVPDYESIATSEQLGPNVFWSLAVIKYASVTNDIDWLKSMVPYLKLSAQFLLTFYDAEMQMLAVPGPLWIDVLVRENYTSDSNAIAPYAFRTLATVFDLFEDDDFASELRAVADSVTVGMNRHLWAGDHYITQLNPDDTTRDFVDYDSNLLAVAFGVTPDDRVSSLLERVDSGQYTHVRATWCSEIPYSGDADDCYIVGGDVCGDSVVTLARIGWADSHARKRTGDVKTFENLLLEPLQRDLLADTWLYERYDDTGTQIRTPFYFEYPSFVAMMLMEIRYGIDIRLNEVQVSPFAVKDFEFRFGVFQIQHSPDRVSIHLPAASFTKRVHIDGLLPSTTFVLSENRCMNSPARTITSDTAGKVEFDWVFCQKSVLALVKKE